VRLNGQRPAGLSFALKWWEGGVEKELWARYVG